MNIQSLRACIALCAFVATGSALAVETESTAVPTQAPAAAYNAARQMPKLNITWDCGSCEQNEKVAPLLEDSYANELQANGFVLSNTEIAEVRIVEYRQRPPGMRIAFGFMAGKDILGVSISYRGQVFKARDYSANILEGMNALCSSVAKLSYRQLVAASAEKASQNASKDL